eukprot:6193196-Pleurochrysis_carterae.AAC.1
MQCKSQTQIVRTKRTSRRQRPCVKKGPSGAGERQAQRHSRTLRAPVSAKHSLTTCCTSAGQYCGTATMRPRSALPARRR